MATSYQEYQRVILRLPGVISARVFDDAAGAPRVHVVSDASNTPRQLIRQLVSLLRNFGWKELRAEMVTVVQLGVPDGELAGGSRLRIAGYSVARDGALVEGTCRLSRLGTHYEGKGVGPSVVEALAQATIAAVNEAIGERMVVCLTAGLLDQGGVPVVLVTARDGQGEILTGTAVKHEVLEEAIVRAALDAVNRRVVLYTGSGRA